LENIDGEVVKDELEILVPTQQHSESKSASFTNLEAIEEDNDEECLTPRNI
jgi:hypothetical protein